MFCVTVQCCNCNLNPKEGAFLSVCICSTCLLLAHTDVPSIATAVPCSTPSSVYLSPLPYQQHLVHCTF
jgi:hypothetical protein